MSGICRGMKGDESKFYTYNSSNNIRKIIIIHHNIIMRNIIIRQCCKTVSLGEFWLISVI